MPRRLVVVDRYNLSLYERLTQKFAGDGSVTVIKDRRRAKRRRRFQMRHVDRRRSDRRSRPELEERLRSEGFFITSLEEPALEANPAS